MTDNIFEATRSELIDMKSFINKVERILQNEYSFSTKEKAKEDACDLLTVSCFLSRLGKGMLYSDAKEYFRLVEELEKAIFNHSKNLIDDIKQDIEK